MTLHKPPPPSAPDQTAECGRRCPPGRGTIYSGLLFRLSYFSSSISLFFSAPGGDPRRSLNSLRRSSLAVLSFTARSLNVMYKEILFLAQPRLLFKKDLGGASWRARRACHDATAHLLLAFLLQEEKRVGVCCLILPGGGGEVFFDYVQLEAFRHLPPPY